MVINFDMPDKIETYIHRIGRSGRYHRTGKSISFIVQTSNYDEIEKVHAINKISAECAFTELEPNIEDF
jgi:superfamily II DNA/RNA helicase